MAAKKMYVCLLDKCSVTYGEERVEDNARRVSKVWLLLAYLVCNRNRSVPQDELIQQLWEAEGTGNPAGTLKTTLWRARQLLEILDPEHGHEVILYEGGGYRWNSNVPVETDFEMFEALCRKAEGLEDEQEKLETMRRALALYRTDFLERYAAEMWVNPLSAYYSNLYTQTALKQLELLQSSETAAEAVQLCRNVLHTAPYNEEVYQCLMRSYMYLDDYEKADAAYEELRVCLFDNLGVLPNKESREIHKDIIRHLNHQFLSADMLREQLQERDPEPGPLLCEFHVFRQFYHAEARSVSRRGDAIHVGMLTVAEKDGGELQPLVVEQTMDRLQAVISGQLRQGDVVSRCSVTQFVVLLQANYENSNMVCERIINAFKRAHPHAPVQIQHIVLSLEPMQVSPGERRTAGKKYGWSKK